MSDRLHDHLTPGFRRGCVACAQLEADLARVRLEPAARSVLLRGVSGRAVIWEIDETEREDGHV